MSDEGKKRLLGILLGLLVLAGFMTGFLGMALSEKKQGILYLQTEEHKEGALHSS